MDGEDTAPPPENQSLLPVLLPETTPPPKKRGRGRPAHWTTRLDRGLLPWHRALARWLVEPATGASPALEIVTAKADELAGCKVPKRHVQALRLDPQFIAYLNQMEDSVTDRARANLEVDYDWYVAAHKQATEMAIAAADHRAIAKYTVPIIDRVAPKRVEGPTGGQTIVIQVTGAQVHRLRSAELAEIVVERPEEVTDDEH